MTFTTQIITLYPDMFPGPLGTSLAGRQVNVTNDSVMMNVEFVE
tara:strand:+ start:892 stop:1023 length:132 start_codon:yes stop_codon:yes gene_type:complete